MTKWRDGQKAVKEPSAVLDLDVFRSNVCHQVRDMGELDFIVDTLQSKIIFNYWNENKQFQALYEYRFLSITLQSPQRTQRGSGYKRIYACDF